MQMSASTSIRWIQYVLHTINFLFTFFGTVLIATGTAVLVGFEEYEAFMGYQQFKPAQIFVALGAVIVAISFFGTIAAIGRSTLLINLYAVLLVLIVLFEVGACIAIVVLRGNIIENMEHNMATDLDKNLWERTQTTWRCCGVKSPFDWIGKDIDGPEVYYEGKSFKVPQSCCSVWDCKYLHETGCISNLEKYFFGMSFILGMLIALDLLSKITALVLSISLSKLLRRLKTKEEMERQREKQALYEQISAETRRNASVTSILDIPS